MFLYLILSLKNCNAFHGRKLGKLLSGEKPLSGGWLGLVLKFEDLDLNIVLENFEV